MMKMKRLIALAAIILAGSTAAAIAEDLQSGEYEYMTHCAACHGEGADGKGPLVTYFREPVPDLTVLAKTNEGAFPFLETLMIVDGRTGLRGHGGVMPVWGDTFEAEPADTVGIYGAETIARGRLLSLVEYLVSVQQE